MLTEYLFCTVVSHVDTEYLFCKDVPHSVDTIFILYRCTSLCWQNIYSDQLYRTLLTLQNIYIKGVLFYIDTFILINIFTAQRKQTDENGKLQIWTIKSLHTQKINTNNDFFSK